MGLGTRLAHRRLLRRGVLQDDEHLLDFDVCGFRTLSQPLKVQANVFVTEHRLLVEVTSDAVLAVDFEWIRNADNVGLESLVLTDAFGEEYGLFGLRPALRKSFVDRLIERLNATGT